MLNLLRKSTARKALGGRLHALLLARAREPVFFREFAVPDTMDGRFDLVALHAWLALERFGANASGEAAQALTDALFIGFDEALREQGIGDMGMGRKMENFASAFYGRIQAYGAAKDTGELAAAIARNLYRGSPSDDRAHALAAYAQAAREHLKYAARDDLAFGPLPELGAP